MLPTFKLYSDKLNRKLGILFVKNRLLPHHSLFMCYDLNWFFGNSILVFDFNSIFEIPNGLLGKELNSIKRLNFCIAAWCSTSNVSQPKQ